jgi:hypothetical protein
MTISSITSAPATAAVKAAVPTQSVSQAVSTATATLASSTYTTSVGGKSYAGNVSQSNGTYTISVPNLPGATVTATPLSAAEVALNARISVLV